ncbi:Uncharacterized protein TPAR_06130 [Tolypocladium paradoxum]|uniref:Uncharacterized protein n=1 Tax=Tolypocladium paradoxum TaxID=94208 RepID=A0A2S4KU12_9HYPO|nr:Uncharacterized protein TPAR_06130 [Tolypocladium paradoxum]
MDACTECAGWTLGTPSPQLGGDDSWNRYIALHGFQSVWEGRDQTEQDKYGDIVARLEEEEKGRKAAEVRLVREKKWWSERRRLVDLDQHEAELGVIFAAADEVQLAWAGRTNADSLNALHEELWAQARPQQLYSKVRVWVGDHADVNSKEVTVATTLSVPRYYLGHQGGDFVFRYHQEDNGNGLEDLGPDDESAKTTYSMWEKSRWRSDWRWGPVDLPGQFQYCGQVPRHLKEYTARLEVVLPAVVLVVVSLIGFVPDQDNLSLPEELEQLRRLDVLHSSRGSFAELRRQWEQRFPTVPDEVRNKVRRSAMVLEFAHLLAKMTAAGARALPENLASVVHTLERATGWTFFEMVDRADEYTARRAVHDLLHAKEFEHMFIFQDAEIEHVHDYYTNRNFRTHRSHPLRRYESVDVSAALAVCDSLLEIGSEEESSESKDDTEWNFETTLGKAVYPNAVNDEAAESVNPNTSDNDLAGAGDKPDEPFLFNIDNDDSSDEDFSDFENDDEDEPPKKQRRTSKSTAAAPKKKQPATRGCNNPKSSLAAENYTIAAGQKRKRTIAAPRSASGAILPSEDQRVPRTFEELDYQDSERRSTLNLATLLDG